MFLTNFFGSGEGGDSEAEEYLFGVV